MHSCIYAGSVRHRRLLPVTNEFRYSIFMMYLDLAELDQVFAPHWFWSTSRPALAWFRRKDHYGEPSEPLHQCIRDLVERETGRRPEGPIRLLTNLRHFGYCFNPVSFYYCLDTSGVVQDVVMEVNNTPWGESHCYVLPRHQAPQGNRPMRFEFDKAFHVSPFLPMDMHYRCNLTEPGERLFAGIENWRDDRKVFDAHLALEREPVGSEALARHLLKDPLITARVIALIMWQAARLWIKRVPFYSHPEPT